MASKATPKQYTLAEVVDLIEAEVVLAGGLRVYARQIGTDPGYLSRIISGQQEPGPLILDALNLRRVLRYEDRRARR